MKGVTSILAVAAAMAAAAGTAGAQTTVYRCADGSHSDRNCTARVVRTYEASVPRPPKQREGASRMLPGETVAEFNVRKRRAHMRETDRDECARLDKRIAFEQQRAQAVVEDEAAAARAALDTSRGRYRALGC